MLHVADAVREGHNQITVRTVDTDILVLAIATAEELSVSELWVAFGTGNNFRYLAAHEMSIALGRDRCYSNAHVPCSYYTAKNSTTCYNTVGSTVLVTWRLSCVNSTVEPTVLFAIVPTALFSNDEPTIAVHGCWNRRKHQ